jgi:hypothetical protein
VDPGTAALEFSSNTAGVLAVATRRRSSLVAWRPQFILLLTLCDAVADVFTG